MYGTKFKVWPYGLFNDGKMSAKVWVPCVYNPLPWGILQLNIYDLDNLWCVPLFLQDKWEKIDQISLLYHFLLSVSGKMLLLASDYLISSRIQGWLVLDAPYRSRYGYYIYRD